MKISLLRSGCLSCFMLAPMLGAPVFGAELEYGLRVGGSYSDNVERTPTNEQSTGAAVVGVDLRGQRTTGRLRYNVFGDLEYQDYFEAGVDSQTFGQLSAQTSYAFVPDRFEWMLSGAFDQTRQDLLRPAAPDNLDDVITLSTGPQWNVRFGNVLEGMLEAHYTTADYRRQPLDSETVGGVATLGRRLSEQSYIGLGGSYDNVSYTSGSGVQTSDFDRREYFLRFSTEGIRTTIEADAGYAEVAGANVDSNGPMARVRATRKLTPFLSGFIAYTREFPTSEGAAFTPAASTDAGVDASTLTAAPRKVDRGELGLNLEATRTKAALAYVRRREFDLALLTRRNFDEVNASFTRLMTRRSSVTLYGAYNKEKITGIGDDANETVYGSNIDLALGRTLTLDLRVEHRKRDSDVAIGSYSETSGGIFLRYGSARQTASP